MFDLLTIPNVRTAIEVTLSPGFSKEEYRMISGASAKRILGSTILVTVLFGLAALTACEPAGFKPEIQPLPAGLPNYEAMEIPADNPMTPEKVWRALQKRK